MNDSIKTGNSIFPEPLYPKNSIGNTGKTENTVPAKNSVLNLFSLENSTSYSNQPAGSSLALFNFWGTSVISEKKATFDPSVSERTKTALNQIDGVCWAGKVASNGNRETAVIFPKGVDLNKPVEVIYFFHGDGGNIHDSIMPPTPPLFEGGKHGFKGEIEKLGKERNAIFVFPEAPKKWKLDPKMNMAAFQKEMTEKIMSINPETKIGSINVKAFSGGGYAVYKAATEGRLTADRVDLLDASYDPWGITIYNSLIKSNPDIKMNVFHVKDTDTQYDAMLIKENSKSNPNIKVITDPFKNSLWESHYSVANTHFAD